MQTAYKWLTPTGLSPLSAESLISQYNRVPWVHRDGAWELDATCARVAVSSPTHSLGIADLVKFFGNSKEEQPAIEALTPPHDFCSCGIYCLSSTSYLVQLSSNYGSGTLPVALSTWGKTIPYQYGHLAQHARVEAILPPKCWGCFRRAPYVDEAGNFLCGICRDSYSGSVITLEQYVAPLATPVSWDPILDFGCIICKKEGHTFREHGHLSQVPQDNRVTYQLASFIPALGSLTPGMLIAMQRQFMGPVGYSS